MSSWRCEIENTLLVYCKSMNAGASFFSNTDCFKKVRTLFGGLDIVVNNAVSGLNSEWRGTFAVNTVSMN